MDEVQAKHNIEVPFDLVIENIALKGVKVVDAKVFGDFFEFVDIGFFQIKRPAKSGPSFNE
jgi:hypothetical protein